MVIFLVPHGKISFLPAKCLPSWECRSRVPYTFQALLVAQNLWSELLGYVVSYPKSILDIFLELAIYCVNSGCYVYLTDILRNIISVHVILLDQWAAHGLQMDSTFILLRPSWPPNECNSIDQKRRSSIFYWKFPVKTLCVVKMLFIQPQYYLFCGWTFLSHTTLTIKTHIKTTLNTFSVWNGKAALALEWRMGIFKVTLPTQIYIGLILLEERRFRESAPLLYGISWCFMLSWDWYCTF